MGDVICIRSRPHALSYCRTAALIIRDTANHDYALPPNTQLTLEEVLSPPWIASFRRWHQYENESGGIIYVDRNNTVYNAEVNINFPTVYMQADAGCRTRYRIVTLDHPRVGQLVDAIDYSPDATFERIITGCRCFVLTATYALPVGPAATAPMGTGSSASASASSAAAAPGSRVASSLARAQAASLKAAAELKVKSEAADAAVASLVAEEEAEKAAEESKQAKSKKKKQRQKQKKDGRSQDQPPSRGALAVGRDPAEVEEDAKGAEDEAAAMAEVEAARRSAEEEALRAAAVEAEREKAEREARRAGSEEAAALEASRWLAEEEARARAASAAAEQERQMAMARVAADDPPDVIAIDAFELQQALDVVGAQGEVGEGGFGKVFAAQLPSLPGRGRVAIKLAASMDPSTLLQEVELLRQCRHPNVLLLLGFCGDTRLPCMVTPLMRGGSLDDRLLLSPAAHLRLRRLCFSGGPHLSWQQRLSALCDAARGLVHLHASRTFHRDVKSGNILLDGSLQRLQTAHSTLLVHRAFLSDVGLAKVREVSAGTGAMTHLTTRSLAFSPGFGDPLLLNSNQHSEKSDSYGIGISVLMCLVGRPAPCLMDDCMKDVEEAAESGDGSEIIEAARATADWSEPAACALAKVVWGLSRQPLKDELAALEELLNSPAATAAAALAGQLAGEAPVASTPAADVAEAAGEDAADGRSGGLTRQVGQLDRLGVEGGGDAALARLRKHMNAAFLSLMTRLEAKYAEQGHAPLPKEMPEHEKIDMLAPRRLGPLCGHAQMLRIWWNAAKHDRDRWKDPPRDREVEEVVQGAMCELARLGW